MSKTHKLISILFALMLLESCKGNTDSDCRRGASTFGNSTSGPAAPASDDAVRAANAFLATVPIRTNGRPVSIIDMRNRWRLVYDDNRGTGGPVIVVVNKQSGEVVHYETDQ